MQKYEKWPQSLQTTQVDNRPLEDQEVLDKTFAMKEEDNLQNLVADLELELQTKGWVFWN